MSTESWTVSAMARGGSQTSLQALKFFPYWWEAAPPSAEVNPLPAGVDVAIIGAGFTGLSAALTLLRRGRTVAVLERGVPGFGASTRNGGQVGSGNQKFQVKRLIELRGEAKAVAMLKDGVAMLDYLKELVTREGIECRFQQSGRFRAAMRPEHYEAMARDMEDLRHYAGVDSFAVPRAEQHKEIGSDRFFGGSVLPGDCGLHPGLYHQGLLHRVVAAGGMVLGQTSAEAIEPGIAGFTIHTVRGRLRARNVIVATNGYTKHLNGYFDKRIVPVGSALIATESLPPALLDELVPKRRMYGNTNRVFFYFRAVPEDNTIVWGGRTGHLAGPDSPRAYAHLARDMLQTFPQLAPYAITHGWSGQIGYTFDELPHLGATPSGIHYAMGYCGTGVSRSTWFGHQIALQVMGDKQGRTAFDDIAFPSHAFHAFAPAMVPAVATWYRIRDSANF
jgi:glycine/D-amino acid oxidase-like deaminating enzyme